jgi:hypothetical protein
MVPESFEIILSQSWLEKLFRRFTKIFGMLGARFNVDSFFF